MEEKNVKNDAEKYFTFQTWEYSNINLLGIAILSKASVNDDIFLFLVNKGVDPGQMDESGVTLFQKAQTTTITSISATKHSDKWKLNSVTPLAGAK